jgi:predicted Zn-dependent peptidase
MFGRYEWFTNYVEKLNRVTPAMIQQKMQEYFNPARRVVGIYIPEEEQA